MTKKVKIIGSGFAGLSAAAHLAKKGYQVDVFEKNSTFGGRARQMEADGFTFDMGPSWYWMPEVFEKFYQEFGYTTSDFYKLVRLDPSYKVFFGKDDEVDLPASIDELYKLFESIEEGSADQLKQFLEEAEYKYKVGVEEMVYKPGLALTELIDPKLIVGSVKLHVFQSFHKYIRKYFKHPKILQLLEFPVLFLGAMPKETPALYSMMNYADMSLGTWYPLGGMFEIVKAMKSIGENLGVKFHANSNVTKIVTLGDKAIGLEVNGEFEEADIVVGGADYHHVEQKLLPESVRHYDSKYWAKRTMAPSSLLFYLGFDKRIDGLEHHNLFFDEDFERHAIEIYKDPQWPTKPLFYVSVASKTDDSVAPKDGENMMILIPLAPDLVDTEELRAKYYDIVMTRMEKLTGQSLKEHVIYKSSYAHKDFMNDYNAFKGNAYGLANTLMQTANLKPRMKSKKLTNMYFTGQLTVPGPGVPPSIISGEVVSSVIFKDHKI